MLELLPSALHVTPRLDSTTRIAVGLAMELALHAWASAPLAIMFRAAAQVQ